MQSNDDASLWRMLENMRTKRFGGKKNSDTSRSLLQFYPDKNLSYEYLLEHGFTSVFLTYMIRTNFIEYSDSLFHKRQYRLTLQGKCRVLCDKLEVSFLALCILSEAYALHRCQTQDGCRSYYLLNEAYETFDEIYTKKYIQNTAYGLATKGLAIGISDGMLELNSNAIEVLECHDQVLAKLHEWISSIPHRFNVLSINHPTILAKVKRDV